MPVPDGDCRQGSISDEATGQNQGTFQVRQCAGLDKLARGFAQAREGMTLSRDWGRRVEQEAQEAEKWQAR